MKPLTNHCQLSKDDLIVLIESGTYSLSNYPANSIFKVLRGNDTGSSLTLQSLSTRRVHDSIGTTFSGDTRRFSRPYKNEDRNQYNTGGCTN